MSLVVHNPEYMTRVMRFARVKGVLPQLLHELWYLHTYACHDGPDEPPEFAPTDSFPPAVWAPYGKAPTTCHLFTDFAPASFEFLMERDGTRWFNGGLIYHGPQDGWVLSDGKALEDAIPTFSVSLVQDKNRPWSIHT